MKKVKEFFTEERIKSFLFDNRKFIAILLVFLVIGLTFTSLYFGKPETFAPYERAQVVIDPGHGGDDLGATFEGRNEKDDNLRIAHKVKDILEKQGIDVALTRHKDYFVSLENRCRFANRCKADIYVSLHRNSAPDANGVEIWISSKNPPADRMLASDILAGLESVGIAENRGVKTGYARGDGDYYINKHTKMTSCLVEVGFINSKSDNALFDDNIDAYANEIAQAVIKNLNK